jgi:hypothetical protein
MSKKKKVPPPPPIKGTNKPVKVDDRHILPSELIKGAEEEIKKQYSDYHLDRANEKFKLLNGNDTSWKELYEAHLKFKRFISDKRRDWELTFKEELYRQWRKLNGWNMDCKARPMVFAAYTVRDIYGSLAREIYTTLEPINSYIYPGIRKCRYFQLMTNELHDEVRNIIDRVIEIATESNDLYEYRLKLARVYGQPFGKTVVSTD